MHRVPLVRLLATVAGLATPATVLGLATLAPVALGEMASIKYQLDRAARNPKLTPSERMATLQALARQVESILGEITSYIGDVRLELEAADIVASQEERKMRENAEIREEIRGEK